MAKKPPMILVVDDEKANLALMEALLVPIGYEVATASDGLEALEKVTAVSPDVILLDVMMPNLDGMETARRLRANDDTKTIPIVMVTSLQDVEDRIRAIEAGADDFLSKPVERTELRARVKSLIKVKAYNDHMKSYQQELEAEVGRQTLELRKAMEAVRAASLETIYRLCRAAEYKDQETGAHIQRMSHYAAATGAAMGLDSDRVDMILHSAPMHDVGKIAIPDRVLLKPGKLDAEEWAIMQRHTTLGAAILEGSQNEVIQMGELIALHHHEKWDGSGYPRGMRGDDIPLESRITAVADVFDALTSKRPYKEAFAVDRSLEIVKQDSGSHFDPVVVDAFFQAQDEVMMIKDRFSDDATPELFEMFNSSEPIPGGHA